ncbi:P-loop containing nucleoside triphosphate hydrolase [Pseudocohnilembus persalinus]|uniref:p-loop containing nucleoside triphosphate hydrolase n=1 Tax=Pseudocohnilembus persalinus TaxID=266149 RepID=A0A0V0QBB6_PSEPJ|nr:P-loop containing nucleoside triphosphate hydrolase [Pseudocohnilembus persalinus]|eukprot:KRW99513.1 P-loop containing nucleoside triphosphate hydrolase [Pseudocohnilembus persalinus]
MDKLWVDKYRPRNLAQLDYNDQVTELLQKLSKADDLPHLLFYGANGAGKKTRIMAFLNEIYGEGVHHLTSQMKEFKVNKNSSTTAECNIISSNYHLDVTPSDAENQDKVIVQKLIKDVAQTQQIDKKQNFRILVINECDKLTKEAQAGLRRTMEKYIARCRLILVCENIGRVIQPLRSRCLMIRCQAPEENNVCDVLQKVAQQEKFDVPVELLKSIVAESQGNLRSAILSLQTCKMKSNKLTPQTQVYVAEWKKEIQNIAKEICANQTPMQLGNIRNRFYELIVNCIPGEIIIKNLLYELQNNLIQNPRFIKFDKNQILKAQIQLTHHAAHNENQLQQGSKIICHIEAFAAQAMVIIRKLIEQIPL